MGWNPHPEPPHLYKCGGRCASRYLPQNANRKGLATKNGPFCQWLNKFHEKASETYTDR